VKENRESCYHLKDKFINEELISVMNLVKNFNISLWTVFMASNELGYTVVDCFDY
jgi:hypothetical protein